MYQARNKRTGGVVKWSEKQYEAYSKDTAFIQKWKVTKEPVEAKEPLEAKAKTDK